MKPFIDSKIIIILRTKQVSMHKHRFMNNLSSDILKENYHLKNQLVIARKNLKQYQAKILAQLQSAAKTINFNKNFLLFETASEALDAFISLVQEAIFKASLFSGNLASQIEEKQNLTIEIGRKEQKIQKQIQQIQQMTQIIQGFKNEKKQLNEQLSKMQAKYNEQTLRSSKQIARLKLELETLDRTLGVRYMIEKKEVVEKCQKEILEYRQKVEIQFIKNQRELRYEIEKKDRELKGLLATMNNILNYKTKKQTDIGSRDRSMSLSYDEPGPGQLHFLQSVIKPFTDHAQLNDKVSKLRKQLSETQNDKRNLSNKIISLENRKENVEQQLKIIQQKLILQGQKYQDLCAQFEDVSAKNQKMNKDITDMEHYYEHKWNDEFNSVKTNLQKKFQSKKQFLEKQFEEKKMGLAEEQAKSRIQVQMMRVKQQMILNRNFYLEEENSRINSQCQEQMLKIGAMDRLLIEVQCLGNQDKQSMKIELLTILRQRQKIISQHQKKIDELKEILQNTRKSHKMQIQKMKKDHQEQCQEINRVLSEHEAQIVGQKNKKIEDLERVIVEHKEAIQGIQRDISERMSTARHMVELQKEEIIKGIKMDHFQEISKFNERILKFNLQIAELKNKIFEQKEKARYSEAKFEKIIREKQYVILEAHKKANTEVEEKEKIAFAFQSKMDEITELAQKNQSLQVLINSRELHINNLNLEIKEFINEKLTWKNDIKQLKKEYEHGFKELKNICDKRISYYKSRIWELERVRDAGFINSRERECIRSLSEDKRKLEDELNKKEAENLILLQVKRYYEHRTQETQSKICLNYGLKEMRESKQPIFIKKPQSKNRKNRMRQLKTQLSINESEYGGWHSTEKNYQTKRNAESTMPQNRQSAQILTPQEKIYSQGNNELKKKLNSPMNPPVITDQEIQFPQTSQHFRVSSSLI